VDQRALDQRVRDLVVEILGDPRHAASVEAAARAAQDARARRDAELAECDPLIEFLDGRLARREITQERYGRMVAPIEAQATELRVRVETLTADPESGEASEDEVAASREKWDQRWVDATVDERRRLIRRTLRGRRLMVMPVGKAVGFDAARVVTAPPAVQ
jgi:site-specific DNA recombinase